MAPKNVQGNSLFRVLGFLITLETVTLGYFTFLEGWALSKYAGRMYLGMHTAVEAQKLPTIKEYRIGIETGWLGDNAARAYSSC